VSAEVQLLLTTLDEAVVVYASAAYAHGRQAAAYPSRGHDLAEENETQARVRYLHALQAVREAVAP
jgi:hypothetical protein